MSELKVDDVCTIVNTQGHYFELDTEVTIVEVQERGYLKVRGINSHSRVPVCQVVHRTQVKKCTNVNFRS